MKRTILKISMVAALAAITGYGIYANQKQETTLSDIALANVEALAQGESGGGVSCYCGKIYGSGCKADNHGAPCNPSGSSNCWDYDRNCS